MNASTHATVGGLTGGLILAQTISSHTSTFQLHGYTILPVVIVAGAVVGGISPDIDMKRSVSGRFFRNVLRGAIALCAAFLALMYFLPRTGIMMIDNALTAGSGIDKTYPVILAVFMVALLFVVENSRHRGFTHTPVALIIVSAPMLFMLFKNLQFNGANIVISAQIGFVLGWLSHMVIDTFNYPGTPWLWPISSNHLNIMRIDSGTDQEKMFYAVSVILFVLAYAAIILL